MIGLDALQEALAAEHAAIYGYGILGARLAGDQLRAAEAAYVAHLARRDRLAARVAAAGSPPRAADPAYVLPFPVEDAAAAVRLAVTLEERVAATYADLVTDGGRELRTLGATALQESAVRAASWRGEGVPFPGLPERS